LERSSKPLGGKRSILCAKAEWLKSKSGGFYNNISALYPSIYARMDWLNTPPSVRPPPRQCLLVRWHVTLPFVFLAGATTAPNHQVKYQMVVLNVGFLANARGNGSKPKLLPKLLPIIEERERWE
jgi:hypothetical protein